MSGTDRLSNAAQDAKGKIKEATGKVTNNEQLEAEGKVDQGKATAKDKVEDGKDAVAGAYNDATDRNKE